MTQLRASSLQKGELLKLLLALPLRCLPDPMLRRKLALKKGNLSDKAFSIFASRG
jgi:hypothetical protein